MWFLKAKGGTIVYLTKNEYTIGRKNCQINIGHDDSISRTHVKLILKDNNLYVCDCKSTYGTFIQNEKLPPQTEVKVEDNAEIKLGVQTTTFIAKKISLRVCFSNITSEDKIKFLHNMQVLKANFSKDWIDNCTHLTVGVVKLTSKILLALCNNVPIVSTNYWTKFAECVQGNKEPPSTKDFVPRINESLLSQNVTLEYKDERRTLFAGKMFVFLTKLSMDSISDVVRAAGGKCIFWEKANITKTDLLGKNPEYLLIEENSRNYSQESQSTVSFFDAVKILQSEGRRSIPFQEIALAVLFASCAENCNPEFSRRNILNINSQRSSQSQSIVFASNTQSQLTQQSHIPTQSSIPDSREMSSEVPDSIPESNISLYGLEYAASSSEGPSKTTAETISKSVNKTPVLENKTNKPISPTLAEQQKRKMREEMEKENPFKIAKRMTQNLEKEKNKRVAETQITQDSTKKTRIEGSQNPFFMKKQPQSAAIFSKPSTSTGSTKEDERVTSCETTSTTSEHLVVENPYGKRKATTDLNESKKKANTDFFKNPFSIAKKSQMNKDRANSTLQSGAKKSVENISFTSEFNQSSKVNQSLRTTSSSAFERKVEQTIDSMSRFLNLGYEVVNGTLIGKTLGVITRENRSVKAEPKEDDEIKNEEVEEYKKSFKSMVVRYCNDIIVKRPNDTTYESTAFNNTSTRNFKKFKKVHPKRYQTNIIPPEAYKRIICGAEV